MASIDPLTGDELYLNSILTIALADVRQYLTDFAANPEYLSKMRLAFGNSLADDAALNLGEAWQSSDFSIIGSIQFLSSQQLNGANGAYAAATDTIYLSQEFVVDRKDNPEAIVSLLLEEIGHRIDRSLNEDSAGDEGAIFSALVRGTILSEIELQQLKSEDDTATIILNGQALQIEQDQTIPADPGGNDLATAADLGLLGSTPIIVNDFLGDFNRLYQDYGDFFKFELAENSTLNLQTTGASDRLWLRIYDIQGFQKAALHSCGMV